MTLSVMLWGQGFIIVVNLILLLLCNNNNSITSDKLLTIYNIICFLCSIVRMGWRIHNIGFAVKLLCFVFSSFCSQDGLNFGQRDFARYIRRIITNNKNLFLLMLWGCWNFYINPLFLHQHDVHFSTKVELSVSKATTVNVHCIVTTGNTLGTTFQESFSDVKGKRRIEHWVLNGVGDGSTVKRTDWGVQLALGTFQKSWKPITSETS